MAKVSVLVAVYNAERYLRTCLDSLVGQTLDDIQVICIDDASTDGSPAILEEYRAKDGRIEVLTLARNVGQAVARNEGLKVARGEYVCFLDSDDWYSRDALAQAVSVFESHPQTGCVLFRVRMVESDGSSSLYPMADFECMTGNEAFEASLTWKIHGVYMVRADIHRQYPYDDTVRSYSDDNTTRLHYLCSQEVRSCKGTYYYLQHSASVTHQVSVRRFDYLRANESMKRMLKKHHVSERVLDVYENVRWLNVIDVYMFYFLHRRELSAEDRQAGLTEIRWTWESIETKRLTLRNRWKFGYMPLRFSWALFRLQEEVYFSLRMLIKSR